MKTVYLVFFFSLSWLQGQVLPWTSWTRDQLLSWKQSVSNQSLSRRLSLETPSLGADLPCTQTGNCVCEAPDGSSIDLTPLDGSTGGYP